MCGSPYFWVSASITEATVGYLPTAKTVRRQMLPATSCSGMPVKATTISLVTSLRAPKRPRAVSQTAYQPMLVAFSPRSEEHTSELQSLMRISYAVFCLKKKKKAKYITQTHRRHKPTRTHSEKDNT